MTVEMSPPEATIDEKILRGWIGRSESHQDHIAAKQARLMQQTLDRDATLTDGDALPELWHWIYFAELVPLSGLGRDGHPARGGFFPPVGLPRRMWAGGRFRFATPLILGAKAERTSSITDVTVKSGRSGQLCFVTATREVSMGSELCVSEEQDLVYREDPEPGAPPPPETPPPDGAVWTRTVEPTPVMLFRYSALTFNGHRIHYDRGYCHDVDGYPGLVFHGPLTATLLADLVAAEVDRQIATFSFRAVAPLFDTAPFRICGKPTDDGAELWAETPDGALAMTAQATFRG